MTLPIQPHDPMPPAVRAADAQKPPEVSQPIQAFMARLATAEGTANPAAPIQHQPPPAIHRATESSDLAATAHEMALHALADLGGAHASPERTRSVAQFIAADPGMRRLLNQLTRNGRTP